MFSARLIECSLAVCKCVHLNNLLTAECINICKPDLLPFWAFLRSQASPNEVHDPIACRDETLRFAGALGLDCKGLREIKDHKV